MKENKKKFAMEIGPEFVLMSKRNRVLKCKKKEESKMKCRKKVNTDED